MFQFHGIHPRPEGRTHGLHRLQVKYLNDNLTELSADLSCQTKGKPLFLVKTAALKPVSLDPCSIAARDPLELEGLFTARNQLSAPSFSGRSRIPPGCPGIQFPGVPFWLSPHPYPGPGDRGHSLHLSAPFYRCYRFHLPFASLSESLQVQSQPG